MAKNIEKIGIVGISGYSGGKLLDYLLKHPFVRLMYVSANNTQGAVSDIWPILKGKTKLVCKKYNEKLALSQAENIIKRSTKIRIIWRQLFMV